MSFHVRSISLPSNTEPIALKIKEELNNCRSILASADSVLTSQLLLDGLKGLVNLYDLTQELLCLPRNQQISSLTHEKRCVDEDLELSIMVLDLCSNIRGILVESTVHYHIGCTTRKNKLEAKKVQKDVKICLRSLKQIVNKSRDYDFLMLMETREVTINLLRVVLSFISEPENCKWSFLSKAVQHRRVVDTESLKYFENELECLFKRLMQNRVSLLNSISL